MKKGFRNIIGLALSLVLGACSGTNSDELLSSSTVSGSLPSSPDSPADVTATDPLAIKVYTIYDTANAVNNLTFSETSTTTCSVSASSPSRTCTVIVPEGRLYHSSFNFQFSWMNSTCKLLTFQPYFYRASTAAAYRPPGTTTDIDCSGTSASPGAKCWGGAAPALIPGFPQATANIYLPDESQVTGPQSKVESIASANSLKILSNRLISNDLATGNIGNAYTAAQLGGAGDGYIAGSFIDYKWTCRDDWFDPVSYSITLKVIEQNSSSGSIDNIYSWSHL